MRTWSRKRIIKDENFIEYCRRPAHYLTDKYIINNLFKLGIPREVSINNPELIKAERIKLKITRLIKHKQNGKCKRP